MGEQRSVLIVHAVEIAGMEVVTTLRSDLTQERSMKRHGCGQGGTIASVCDYPGVTLNAPSPGMCL